MTQHLQPVPCPPPWWQPASECFDQVKQFEEMLQAMVDKAVTDKLNEAIQQGTLPPGVVDGSNASPGQVGEWIVFDQVVPFLGYPTFNDTTIPLAVVPAGDWDIWMNMNIAPNPAATSPVLVGGYSSWVVPIPAGMHNQLTMAQTFSSQGLPIDELIALNSSVTRANFTVPTLIPLRVIVMQNTDPSLTEGQVFIHMEGRRMR